MLLSDYQWSGNPRGLHITNAFVFDQDVNHYARLRLGWLKLVCGGDEFLHLVAQLLPLNITPIVRMYLLNWGNRPLNGYFRQAYIDYAAAGVKWFEFYNEPNQGVEWHDGIEPDWRDSGQIQGLMDNWLNWAEFIIQLGGYPGFIPLAESDTPNLAAVRWMDAMLNDLANRHYERFLNVLRSGCYCATHPYILNHFYQERVGGGERSARPPSQVKASEGGWHFEYPYDPISQAHDPGRTVLGGTALTPYGDPVGLLAMGQLFNDRCRSIWGTRAIPVVGTEGGIWNLPAPDEEFQPDTRFPPVTNYSHGEGTVAMFDWIATDAPEWMFGVTLWKEDAYRERGQVTLSRLEQTQPVRKSVPAIPVMLDGSEAHAVGELLKGPGPIHGTADFHVVVLDAALGEAWFFDTAEAYWQTFKPILTTSVAFFEWLPYETSLAVTFIVSAENQAQAETRMRQNYPNAYVESIVVFPEQTLEQIATIFAQRVATGRRFG